MSFTNFMEFKEFSLRILALLFVKLLHKYAIYSLNKKRTANIFFQKLLSKTVLYLFCTRLRQDSDDMEIGMEVPKYREKCPLGNETVSLKC